MNKLWKQFENYIKVDKLIKWQIAQVETCHKMLFTCMKQVACWQALGTDFVLRLLADYKFLGNYTSLTSHTELVTGLGNIN